MKFLKRKAHIEFLEKEKIRITTPLRQKDFDLNGLYTKDIGFIDLIDLSVSKKFENLSGFYLNIINEKSDFLGEYFDLNIFVKMHMTVCDKVDAFDFFQQSYRGAKTVEASIPFE